MRRTCGISMLALLLALPGAAAAQVAWDSPLLIPPQPQPGYGLYLMDVSGGGVGVLGTWRAPGWNFDVRAGLADARRNDVGVLGGVTFNGAIARSDEQFPLDVDWVFGAGIGVNPDARLSFPLGLTLGHTFPSESATFTPYATPRVVLDAFLGRPAPPPDVDRNDVNLRFAVDLGLDLRFDPGWLVRFGATVGDREAVAIGIVF